MPERITLVIHDTSVLINFHRASLLRALLDTLGKRMRWSATVARECRRLETTLHLPGLTEQADAILGEPLFPNADEHRRIRQLREQFARPGDHPDEHLGEAEIIAIVTARRLDAFIATDDREAARIATPIRCVSSWQLLHLAHGRDIVSAGQAVHFWSTFVGNGGVPGRTINTEQKFVSWLRKVS